MKITLKNKKRGSTLILALVLTMVLFIMGIAFISSSTIERDMSTRVNDNQYLSDGADYTVDYIKKVLKEDLFDDPANLTGFLQGNASYDYPDKNNSWLASITPELATDSSGTFYYWPQVTDLWNQLPNKTSKETFGSGTGEYDAYRLDYHYDPDPSFRDENNRSGYNGNLGAMPHAWDFCEPISWRYIVEGHPGILCRVITQDEPIYSTLLNCDGLDGTAFGGYTPYYDTRQWNYPVPNGSGNLVNTYIGAADMLTWFTNEYNSYRSSGIPILDSGWSTPTWPDAMNLSVGTSNRAVVELISPNSTRALFPDWYYSSGTKYFNSYSPTNLPSFSRADADGDGVADSRWYRRYRVNAKDDYLYVAVRIIDNSAMINLNTALHKPDDDNQNPYDGSVADNANISSPLEIALDNWDGSSVSHIDATGIARVIGTSPDGIFNLYNNMLYSSFSAKQYVHDYCFAVNKAASPYAPRQFGKDTTDTFTLANYPIDPTNTYTGFDISEELTLRSRFLVQPATPGNLEMLWHDTLDPDSTNTGVGYNINYPYAIPDSDASGFDDCYEYTFSGLDWNGFNWFEKAGSQLRGTPAYDTSIYMSRRPLVTTYSKDRLIRPEFNFDSGSTVDNYQAENIAYNITDLYDLDEYMFGMRKCQVNIKDASADKDGNAIFDNLLDMDHDGVADDFDADTITDAFDPITIQNIASAFYMSIRSLDSAAASVNTIIRNYFGDYSSPLDLNSERLASVFTANYLDYFDIDTTESIVKVRKDSTSTDNLKYDVSGLPTPPTAAPFDRNHEELYFGFESISRIEDEVLNISKVSFLNVSAITNNYTGPGLNLDTTTAGIVPAGNYLAIELFNPSTVKTKSAAADSTTNMDLRNYLLLVLNQNNEVKAKVDFNSFGVAPNFGTLPTVATANAGAGYNTMVVVLFDLSISGLPGGVTDTDFLYDPTPGTYVDTSGTTKTLGSTEYAFLNNPYDRVQNTFGGPSSQMVYVDVSSSSIFNPASYINSDFSLALVKKPVSGGTTSIADQIGATTDVYPCDVVSLASCEKCFQSYRYADPTGTFGNPAGSATVDTDFNTGSGTTPRGMFDNNAAGDDILRTCYRRDVFGSSFDVSNNFDGSFLLLPASFDNSFNPWCFGYQTVPSGTASTIVPPNIGDQIDVPNDNANYPLGVYESLASTPNQLNLVYNTADILNTIDNGNAANWVTLDSRDAWAELSGANQRSYYTQLAADKAAGYAKVAALMEGNFDTRQLYDRFNTTSDKLWLKSLGQLQDIFTVSARCVEIEWDASDDFPSDNGFPTTGSLADGRVYYQPFMNALTDAVVSSVDNRYCAVNYQSFVGNPARINLGSELFANIPDFMTVIDYTRDGINNDGNYYYERVNAENDGIDNDGDSTLDNAGESYSDDLIDQDGYVNSTLSTLKLQLNAVDPTSGYANEDEYMQDQPEYYDNEIYGRININTAPWYVLARLPWVTEEMAQAIVAYRDQRALYNTTFDSGIMNYPAVNYATGRANGMWDAVYGSPAPFTVRDGENNKGFRSIGELMNVTHGLKKNFGAAAADAANVVASYVGEYVAGYQETTFKANNVDRVPTSASETAGLARGITYDNAFDIQRWGRTANNYVAVSDTNGDAVITASEINTNNALATWWGNGAIPFFDTNADGITNDDNERNAVFNRISNLVTTRSDVFTAYILVRIGNQPNSPQRRYIGIFDRSKVYGKEDQVRLVSLYQVPSPN